MSHRNERIAWQVSICAVWVFALLILWATCTQSSRSEQIKPRRDLAYGTPTPDFVERVGYVAGLDGRHRGARWTLHYLDAKRLVATPHDTERGSWITDEYLPREFRQTAADHRGTDYDVGHLVPAADCLWDHGAFHETFLLSNTAPQAARMNRGIWRTLEKHIRGLAKDSQVWCATGTIFGPSRLVPISVEPPAGLKGTIEWIGPNHVPVPSHFFKCVLVRKGDDLQAMAWAVPNRDEGLKSLDEYRVSVDQVEHWSGLDLWDGLPDEVENELER